MHTPTLALRRAAPALLAASLAAARLHAQSAAAPAPATNLPPIIVQASRAGRTPQEIPAHVQVITAEQIARGGHRNVVDVLQKQAGVFVRDLTGNPANAQVSMRGYGANSSGRVLILVNGERLNNPDMSSPNLLRIPVQSVSRIEIVRGCQTVLHGDFAAAGVINIITAEPGDAPATTLAASAGAYDTYGAHLSRRGAFDDGVTYFAAADWTRSGGYRANGDYETYDLNAAVAKQWDDARSLALSAFYHDSTYGMPGSLTWRQFQDDPRQTLTPDDQTDLSSWGVNLGGSAGLGAEGLLEANLTASRRESDSQWHGLTFRSFLETEVDSYAFTPRYTLNADLAGRANRLTLGSDLRLDRASSDAHGLSWSSWGAFPYRNAYDYDRTSWAGYLQDEFFLTETLSLTLGARAERFFNRITNRGGADSHSDHEAAYEAALLYRPLEDLKLYARAARTYRAPFFDEVVGWGGVPNPDLTPETGLALEAGAEVTLAREWTAALAVYQTDLEDEIYYAIDARGTGSNVNSPDDTRRRGLEAALRWAREGVAAAALNYDYVDACFAEGANDGNTFPLVPRHTLSLNGEVTVARDLALLGGVRYISEQYLDSDFANRQPQLKAYGLLDLAVRYEPAFAQGLRLLAGVDNVLDKEYASYAGTSTWSGNYYYPANARTWKVCASYTF